MQFFSVLFLNSSDFTNITKDVRYAYDVDRNRLAQLLSVTEVLRNLD